MRAEGDCYEVAGKYLMDACLFEPDCGLILVHAEVTGQGPVEGLKYGHAFVLDSGTVIDKSNGRNTVMSQKEYYEIGKIGSNVHHYSFKEFRRKVTEYKHWGPWDLETESGY
jgi:hypothetical protein